MDGFKSAVVAVLNRAVSRYLRRNHIKVIAVAGSVGKTSTANAIRTVLSQKYRVHQSQTAYNTDRSVHLEIFGLTFASSLVGWAWAITRMLLYSLGKANYEVLVVEVGTDKPGEMQAFAWLQPDIGILTAIAPEHMEWFKTIEAVAKEELLIAGYCNRLVFNSNAVARKYLPAELAGAERLVWYGKTTDYEARNYQVVGTDVRADFRFDANLAKSVHLQILGEHSLDALVAATVVASQCDMTMTETIAGLKAVQAVPGRMQRLSGLGNSVIIDDSYNASPRAVKAALDVLGQFDAPQRIAILGSMNEMGDYSPQAHREVGTYCDPAKLSLVLTIGADANQYLAAEVEKRGCAVERCTSPYQAGAYLKDHLKAGAVVLFKGSQNGVFVEEAIKPILADQTDETRLVRQSAYWMQLKRQQFGDANNRDAS